MKKYLPFLIPALLFLFLKLTSLGIRFSDTNIYFYTAYELLQGKMLYKDIFFTNFPLLIYISTMYQFISGGNIYFYYFTASLEAVVAAFCIYTVLLKQTKNTMISIVSCTMYLFSYLLLATSDHQTGVFLASAFSAASYLFFQRKQYFITGILVASAILTKAYFLPIALAYLFVLNPKPYSLKSPLLRFIGGGVLTGCVILLPTLLFAFHDFWRDIVTYSLVRPQGISKSLIFNALLTREFFLLGLSILSICFIKKYRFFGVLSLLMIFFFLLYKDFYFYYFNIAAPFLCIFLGLLYSDTLKKFTIQKAVIPTFLGLIICLNLFQYFTTTRNQVFTNFPEVVNGLKILHPPVLYGANDITPLLAYATNTPLLNNIVDTNPTIFRKGYLDSKTLTKEAIRQKALFIGHGIEYPEYQLKQDMVDEIFDLQQLSKCQLVGNIPIVTEGYINRLQFVTCNK